MWEKWRSNLSLKEAIKPESKSGDLIWDFKVEIKFAIKVTINGPKVEIKLRPKEVIKNGDGIGNQKLWAETQSADQIWIKSGDQVGDEAAIKLETPSADKLETESDLKRILISAHVVLARRLYRLSKKDAKSRSKAAIKFETQRTRPNLRAATKLGPKAERPKMAIKWVAIKFEA